MIINKLKNNNSKGFTLVEAMFAIFLLTFTITTFISVTSSNLFAARYAKNEITANYLMQEVVDFVRNDRDTSVFLSTTNSTTDQAWEDFWNKYSYCSESTRGCYLDILSDSQDINKCNVGDSNGSGCPFLYYDDNPGNGKPFFVTDNGSGMPGKTKTTFKRQLVVTRSMTTPDQIDVKVKVSWKNGSLSVVRSLETSLMKWQ